MWARNDYPKLKFISTWRVLFQGLIERGDCLKSHELYWSWILILAHFYYQIFWMKYRGSWTMQIHTYITCIHSTFIYNMAYCEVICPSFAIYKIELITESNLDKNVPYYMRILKYIMSFPIGYGCRKLKFCVFLNLMKPHLNLEI